MRLVKMRLRRFRRFEDATIILDAPVVAVVGPNESGKTSLLKALVQLSSSDGLDARDITRGYAPENTRIEATFLLSREETQKLQARDSGLSDIRWVTVSKNQNGERSFATNRPLSQEYDSILAAMLPPILEFTDDDRYLRTEYNLQEKQRDWNQAINNLATLAGFNLQQLANAANSGQHEQREEILANANKQLSTEFAESWSQADLVVRLNIIPPNQLQVYVETNGGKTFRLADRSDGLRAFVALVAFLATMKPRHPPVLVLDEAENHLHWDAQADLVNLFHSQEKVSQIIYSTHSPGCLPHDLGHGVRAVVQDEERPDRSSIQNWIWESDSGYRPLLLKMGASTAALTPHRQAVVTEGVSDFILLPSLLREAVDKTVLEYQIVPGIAQRSAEEVRTLNAESEAVLYLIDGDEGRKSNSGVLKDAGIPDARINVLPDGVAIEDLVAGETLVAAINEELRRSGCTQTLSLALPDVGRNAVLKKWYSEHSIAPPRKRAVASRVLELTSGGASEGEHPLLNEKHRSTLKRLEAELLKVFEAEGATSD